MGAVEFFPFWYCSSPYYKFVSGFMRMKNAWFLLCVWIATCSPPSNPSTSFPWASGHPRLSRLSWAYALVYRGSRLKRLRTRFASARAARDNEEFCRKNFEFAFLMNVQSTLAKTDTFGTDTKCPFQRDVRLIKGQITGISKGRHQI